MLTDDERTQTLAEDISSTDVASNWLQKKVEEVRKDMGYSDALPIRSDFKFHRFLNGEAGLEVDVSNPKRHFWYCMVSLSPEMQSDATKANIKLTLAHEIRHCYQDRSGSPKSWERDADLAAAKTYGPQAELDNLEALRYHFQDLNDDVTHGSLPEREQAIRNAFPKADDYMTKPLPIVCSAVGCWQGQGLSKLFDDQPHPAKAAVSGLTRLASGP